MARTEYIDTTAPQFRVGYDATNLVSVSVSSTGDLTIAPTGGDVILSSSRLLVGTAVTSGSAVGDVVIPNAKAVRGVTAAGTSTTALVGLDSDGFPQLGLANGYSKIGSIPAASLSAYTVANNRSIILDETNGALIYHVNGARYRLTGTSF